MIVLHGDLLDTKADYICHQVNCQGKMGSGVAAQIRNKWPEVYTAYNNTCIFAKRLSDYELLGLINIIPIDDGQHVINMYAQDKYGYDGAQYTSYDAFWKCLQKIKQMVPKHSSIAFPMNIGCGLGGANWNIIKTMIAEALDDNYNVLIYLKEN